MRYGDERREEKGEERNEKSRVGEEGIGGRREGVRREGGVGERREAAVRGLP